jgi:TonB family protein
MRIPTIIVFAVLSILAGVVISKAAPTRLTAEAIYTPRPEYPTQARIYHMSGDGLFVLRVQIRTGLVKDVRIERSTGWSILDSAAKRTLKQWRFKSGTSNLPPIKVELPHLKDRFATEDSFVKVLVHFVEFGGRNAFCPPHSSDKKT